MGSLQALAREIGADERTLRRAVEEGTIRGVRPSPRMLSLDATERAYLAGHWDVLATLRRSLRTEPNVSLAVLYGSAARGTDDAGSDVDLLVAFRREAPRSAARLAQRLGRALDRDVDVARLDLVLANEPLLAVTALDEGRVLVDRDGQWGRLRRRRAHLVRRAAELHEARRRRVAAALAEHDAR
jgi:predicted nucleotidyltransferase